MNKILKYWPLVLALVIGIFVRTYQPLERFNYAHDSDLASWMVKDIVVDKHLRLIGQLTSSPGVFIGPLWYYLQIPFYLIGKMDPIYVLGLSLMVGIASIISVYWVFTKLFGRLSAIFATFIYAVSFQITSTEREVVPTTPAYLWSIWFLYAIFQLLKGNKKALLMIAFLWGLIWHINLALVFSVPLVFGVLLFKRKLYSIKDLILPLIVVTVMSLPLLAFEVKHNFGQTRAILTSGQEGVAQPYLKKVTKIIFYLGKNANSLFWTKPDQVHWALVPGLLVLAAVVLHKQKQLTKEHLVIISLWFGSFIGLFSISPLNLSEYYLNGAAILWVVIAALILPRLKWLGWIILGLIIVHNITTLITQRYDDSGYLQKKALAKFITQDAKDHGYPCVAISYMTDPGRNMGYRYWYYLNNLHVNQPKSNSPVYTVVFPHSRAGRLDKSFGSIGLVLPDYDRYTTSDIAKSCAGDNANLTDPMFGFTN